MKALFMVMYNTNCEENAARLLCTLRCIKGLNCTESFDQNQFLWTIVSSLHERKLVSQKEKVEFKRKLLQVPKRNSGAIKKFKSDTSLENGIILNRNPMQVGPIIRCIFQYLNFEQIKLARFISREWASVGLNFLTASSRVTFFKKTKRLARGRNTNHFFQDFPIEHDGMVPFNTFMISGGINNPWRVEELDYFFRNQKEYIRELEFAALYLLDDCWQHIETYDITLWISNSAMTKANAKYHTKLVVGGYVEDTTILSVHYSALLRVKELELRECEVRIQDGIRINPICFLASGVKFLKGRHYLKILCLNEIINFSQLEHLTLSFNPKSDETYLSLDLEENDRLKFQCLDLSHVQVKNWRKCTWIVDELYLRYVPLIEKIRMEIKELFFVWSQIDISFLPQSINSLRIKEIYENTCVCSRLVVLYNLKFLALEFNVDTFSVFYQFVKCPNLVELHLSRSSDINLEVDLSWFPKTLQILNLFGVTLTNAEKKNVQLEKLTLSGYALPQMQTICNSHLKTKVLIVSLQKTKPPDEDINFLYFLDDQKSCRGGGNRIYVGFFDWNIYSFERSPFQNYVDKRAASYVFENQVGKSMGGWVFSRMVS